MGADRNGDRGRYNAPKSRVFSHATKSEQGRYIGAAQVREDDADPFE
jgi:hypothetical protein